MLNEKNMGRGGSSKAMWVWSVGRLNHLSGERSWFVIVIKSSDNFVNTGCKSKAVVCVNSYKSFLTYGMVKSEQLFVTSDTQEGK